METKTSAKSGPAHQLGKIIVEFGANKAARSQREARQEVKSAFSRVFFSGHLPLAPARDTKEGSKTGAELMADARPRRTSYS